jgi:uncharacterized protein (DUF1778 family)
MLRPVALRKRPEGRKNPRVTIEVYDQDRDLIRRAKIAAVSAGVTLREWLLEAARQRLERDHADLPPSA